MHKNFENWKILLFCDFLCQLETFFLKSPFVSSIKTTRQQILVLMNVFNIPIHEVCQKIDKNCKKNEKWKFWGFLSFLVSIGDIFHSRTAFISSKKTTGQRILTLMNVFNIPNHQKFDKNFLKTENGKFWVFCLFRCQFEVFFHLENNY